MKKCKYCKSEIDKDAKICPQCRKNQKRPLIIIISILTIIFGIGIIAGSVSDTDNENDCYITMEKFNQIENGMSYSEVSEIIGCEGVLSTESSSGNVMLKIYGWYAENGISNGTFSFTNDKLTAKSQIGLN